MNLKRSVLILLFLMAGATAVQAQFEEPEIRAVPKSERASFEARFGSYAWSGQGLYNPTTIDRVPTLELRARLQAVYGDPTQKIEDLLGPAFRPGKAIQFEYWFIVDGEIPLMILDLDGPFENGLVYVGASRYVDMMPEIKRTLTRQLMNEQVELAPFRDYFFSPERDQWYNVEYDGSEFERTPIERPRF